MRLQAAMEYLSTYGWAILMLAVVLGVLYFLGIFNGLTQAPRLQPGACYVDRPNGPNTNQFIALEGTCTGEQPKFVTKFNGQNSYVIANNVQTGSQFTISLWVYATSYPSSYTRILSLDKYSSPNQGWIFLGSSSGNTVYMSMFTSSGSEFDSGFANVNLNVWENYIITYNGLTPIIYTDGVASAPDTSGSYAPATGLPLIIGGGDSNNPDSFFSGMISNVQIYNISLSASDAESLYAEGIGGVPQDLQNLVAWFPLNGNSNDYGGNQYSGSPVNVIYTDTWYNTFSAPSTTAASTIQPAATNLPSQLQEQEHSQQTFLNHLDAPQVTISRDSSLLLPQQQVQATPSIHGRARSHARTVLLHAV